LSACGLASPDHDFLLRIKLIKKMFNNNQPQGRQGNVFAISLGFSRSRSAETRPSGDFFFFLGSSKGTTDCDWISALQDPFVIISYPVNHIKFGKLPFLLLLGGCSFVLAFPIGALGNLGCNAILYSPSS